jgi:hypothetical protein
MVHLEMGIRFEAFLCLAGLDFLRDVSLLARTECNWSYRAGGLCCAIGQNLAILKTCRKSAQDRPALMYFTSISDICDLNSNPSPGRWLVPVEVSIDTEAASQLWCTIGNQVESSFTKTTAEKMTPLGHIYCLTLNRKISYYQAMDKPMNVSSRKRDRKEANLTKYVKTFTKNSNKLRKYGADSYLIVHWRGQVWQYSSFVSRPPPIDELVSNQSPDGTILDSDRV